MSIPVPLVPLGWRCYLRCNGKVERTVEIDYLGREILNYDGTCWVVTDIIPKTQELFADRYTRPSG